MISKDKIAELYQHKKRDNQEDLTIERAFIKPDGSVAFVTKQIAYCSSMTREEIKAYNKKNHYDVLNKN